MRRWLRPALDWFAARARGRRPWLFALVLVVTWLWPMARRMGDASTPTDLALHDRAAESIRAIQQGERIYSTVHGYYDRLECVIQDSCATVNPYPPTYLDAKLAWATRFGYRFRFHDGARATHGRDERLSPTGMTHYAMTAVPLQSDAGLPAFCGDDSGAIYRHERGRLPAVEEGQCVPSGASLVGN